MSKKQFPGLQDGKTNYNEISEKREQDKEHKERLKELRSFDSLIKQKGCGQEFHDDLGCVQHFYHCGGASGLCPDCSPKHSNKNKEESE